ncbi:MAG: hypothetical protein ACJ795_21555 [Ktedonobacteraceae bacterium]
MKKTLFYGAAVIAVLFVILGVYYLIPGVYHIIGNGGPETATMHAHKRYAVAFFVLAVAGIAAAFFTRPKRA